MLAQDMVTVFTLLGALPLPMLLTGIPQVIRDCLAFLALFLLALRALKSIICVVLLRPDRQPIPIIILSPDKIRRSPRLKIKLCLARGALDDVGHAEHKLEVKLVVLLPSQDPFIHLRSQLRLATIGHAGQLPHFLEEVGFDLFADALLAEDVLAGADVDELLVFEESVELVFAGGAFGHVFGVENVGRSSFAAEGQEGKSCKLAKTFIVYLITITFLGTLILPFLLILVPWFLFYGHLISIFFLAKIWVLLSISRLHLLDLHLMPLLTQGFSKVMDAYLFGFYQRKFFLTGVLV
jgi:hypothetical protein